MPDEELRKGPLTEEQLTQREKHRKELEDTFSYGPYQAVRKELFAHLRDPAVTFRYNNITFNQACINGLEDAVFIEIAVSHDLKRMAIHACDENDKGALRWCIAKPDKRKSRKMTGPDFSRNIYEMMGWKEGYRYKVLGYKIQHQGKYLYVFDLTIKETFEEKPKKRRKVAKNSSIVSDDTTAALDGIPQATPIQINTRKGFYSDDIARNFGPSVDEYRKSMAVTETDSYVSYAALTGTSTPEAGSEDKAVTEARTIMDESSTVDRGSSADQGNIAPFWEEGE